MNDISNYYEFQKSKNKPSAVVVLLHGLGSNGQDLISLAPYIAAEENLADVLFISPDSPFACDMAPPGYLNSYQWFSLQSRDPDFMREGVERAQPILERFIDQQLERVGLSHDRLVLAGFSQGTMMSLYVAPRLPEKIAGVLGYSGALLGDEGLVQDPDEYQKMPICLIHGQADDVVPVEAHAHATEMLKAAGYNVSGHTTSGLAHSIDEQGIIAGAAFIAKVVG